MYCWGQCLWVNSRASDRSWNGDQWGKALHRLTNTVGDRKTGLRGVRVNNDPYMILMSAKYDKAGHRGSIIGIHLGDIHRDNTPR
jgi:hypothetical protein